MPDKDKGLNRRQFIKRAAGTMGLMAVLSSPLTLVFNRARAAGSISETASTEVPMIL